MAYAECSGNRQVLVKWLVPEETFAYLQEMLSVRLRELTHDCAGSSNDRSCSFHKLPCLSCFSLNTAPSEKVG